jgi:hypothetical protein
MCIVPIPLQGDQFVKQIRKRLTYANVMSSIAVFLVLGGATAIAAGQLGKNSVGSKQLKKNAVTAAKIKKNAVTSAKIKKNAITTAKIKGEAVTGAQINEGTLGTVPSAGVANGLAPLEATHLVGAPGEPGFENGYFNYPGESGISFNPVGFYKDHDGIVHLQGIAKAPPSAPLPIVFTLPAGFRPASGKLIELQQIEESTVILAGSNVVLSGTDISGKVLGGTEAVVLDGITYKAES